MPTHIDFPLTPHLPEIGSDICGRWGLPSRADVRRDLLQMGEGISGRYRDTAAGDGKEELLEPSTCRKTTYFYFHLKIQILQISFSRIIFVHLPIIKT